MLPYKTITEGEAALNRSLTYAESVWLNYSKDKSDYFLYCHIMIIVWIVYSTASLPFVFIELLRSSKLDEDYKIQPKVRLSSHQIFACYVIVIKRLVLVSCPVQLFSCPALQLVGIRTGLELPSGWEIMAQLGVYAIVEDYTNYWVHRGLHFKWGYTNIHRVHHEYTAPIALSAPYAHWAEILILGALSFIGPLLVPGHIVTLWLWFAFRNIEAIQSHSGYDFPWSLDKFIPFYGGAKYHDYHHYVGGLSQSNFSSIFTYCDYIYGTNKGHIYRNKLLNKTENGVHTRLKLEEMLL